jgi:hypothetical protein
MAVAYKSILGRFFGIDQSNGDLVGKDGLVACRAPDNRVANATASTLTVTQDLHDGKVITLNRAAGIAVTLPAPTGSGAVYRFFVGTTVTSNTTTIKVPHSSDTMRGNAIVAQDAGDTVVVFEAGATADTITLNGTTTGGLVGDWIELVDVATDLFSVKAVLAATSTEATPFSATV